jgi:capsular polysaccharide biosynthesis protein
MSTTSTSQGHAPPQESLEQSLELLFQQDAASDRPSAPERPQRKRALIMKVSRLPGRLVPGWLRRRAWLLVVALLAGSAGGYYYGSHTHTSYAAQATLAVPAGATAISPGSANEAQSLAITYAAVLPNDAELLSPAARSLGVSLDSLKHHLAVSVQTGTSVLVVRYTAPTSSQAIRGVNAVATAIVSQKNRSTVVPLNTVEAVQLATSAGATGVFAKHGLEIGLLLGLLIGLIMVLIAERVDPRADKSSDVAEVFGHQVAAVPSELSVPEFGHAVLFASGQKRTMLLAPLRRREVPAAYSIERTLAADYPDTTISVSRAVEEGKAHRLSANAELVLVIRSGERMRALGDTLERLRLTGRAPAWIALLDRHDLYD